MKIQEVMQHIESFAPLGLALSWDNVGLLVGQQDWEVEQVYICLDVTPNAVEKAIEAGCQLILSHHPLIFKVLKNINNPLLIRLIQHKIAVICLHTNLDVAAYSVNHALADALGLEVTGTLSDESGAQNHHLVVHCPAEYADKIAEAAWKAGAGRIGNYSNCGTRHEVQGYFSAGSQAKPFLDLPSGSYTKEVALEFMCDSFNLRGVIAAIRAVHPYETPAYYHFPVENSNPAYGLGLLCSHPQGVSLHQLEQIVMEKLQCPHLKIWTAGKEMGSIAQRIAICGGSGGFQLSAESAKADVFISGDITYHSFLDSRIPIFDAGHYYNVYPVLQFLAEMMSELNLKSQIMPMREHEYTLNMRLSKD